ncbi:hypothetical protein BaRGS_00011285, partial [Batillaria attramentaria]
SGAYYVTNSISGPFPVAIAGGVADQRYEKPQTRRVEERSPYTELQLPPFANSEEGIVNYANTEPRPSQAADHNYVNYETRQNTYEEMQPRSELPTTISIPVGDRSSNYRAEVQALTTATQHLIELDNGELTNLALLTDSLSALQALQSGPTDSATQQMQDNLHVLSQRSN